MLASTPGRLHALFLFQIVLLALVLYFLVPGFTGFLRDGSACLLSAWKALGICKLALAASVCGLHLSRCAMATQLWTPYLKHPRDVFTDFQPLVRQTRLYTLAAALLLFVLVLKVGTQTPRLAFQKSGWLISMSPNIFNGHVQSFTHFLKERPGRMSCLKLANGGIT